MSLNEEVFVYFIGTLYLFIYLVCGLGTSKGTCSNGGNVTSWSEWTCNIENSTATRTGNCKDSDSKDNEHVSETVKVTVYSWTSWSPWSPSCGAAEVHRSRSCVVPSPDSVYCSTCGYENTTSLQSNPSNLPPCCDDYPFGSWTSWHPPCTSDDVGGKCINQSRTRERNCSESSDCTLCPMKLQTRRVILQSWSKWGEWSGTLRPCAENTYRRRSRSCPAPTNPQDYPVYSCCNSTSDDVEYSCCGSVYTLRNISCGSEYCSWECYNETSPIHPEASSPLIKDPCVCRADPPLCSELGRTWNVSLTSTSCSEYTIITMNSETTELNPSVQITMTDTSAIATTLALSSLNTPPPMTVYPASPNSLPSPESVPPNSTECSPSSLPCTPPSANDTSVPVYIWVIIGVSTVGVTVLMVIGAISLLICCYVKKFRQRDDEIMYGHIVLRDGSNSPTNHHGEDSGRTPLLCVDEYQDQTRDGSSSRSSVCTGNGGRLSFDEFTDSEQDGGHLGECREPPFQGNSAVIPDEVIWPRIESTPSSTIVINKSYEESSSVESAPQLGEIVLFNSRDHPQVDEDTTEGEFVDVTEQVGEKKLLGIELPYEVFLIEEKRNTRGEEYKNIKTTSEKRPSTERRPHPKLFDSDDDDDEVFAL